MDHRSPKRLLILIWKREYLVTFLSHLPLKNHKNKLPRKNYANNLLHRKTSTTTEQTCSRPDQTLVWLYYWTFVNIIRKQRSFFPKLTMFTFHSKNALATECARP